MLGCASRPGANVPDPTKQLNFGSSSARAYCSCLWLPTATLHRHVFIFGALVGVKTSPVVLIKGVDVEKAITDAATINPFHKSRGCDRPSLSCSSELPGRGQRRRFSTRPASTIVSVFTFHPPGTKLHASQLRPDVPPAGVFKHRRSIFLQ